DFIRNVNHELRTPSMTLSITTEMLYYANERLSTTERASYLEMAFRSIERLRAILDTVLNFQRTGVGIGKVAFVAVPVRGAVEDAMALTEMIVPLKAHHLRMNVAEHLSIWGNAALLQEVLVNLLTNAHKYSAPTAPIEIVAYQRQMKGATSPFIELRVRDYGLGIPPNQAHLLFQRLSRLPRDIESTIPGSGLGLALCKMIVEAMGGTIRFESTGRPGAGTIFIVALPLPPQH
nr:HAMP domain-containing histidine kinase [Ktedonobacterales bacterium]